MHSSKVFCLLFLAVAILSTSCKKDDDQLLENDDVLVGLWDLTSVTADAYVDVYKIEDIDVTSSGTLNFEPDFTGSADFTMDFAGELQVAKGAFQWQRDGFELVLKMDGDEIRYAIIDSDENSQSLQFTDKEEDTNDEVELTFHLTRRK